MILDVVVAMAEIRLRIPNAELDADPWGILPSEVVCLVIRTAQEFPLTLENRLVDQRIYVKREWIVEDNG